MSTLHAIIIAIIEGLTEFLPISSTGHMAIASAIMHENGDFARLFEIVIQFGAILSVVVLYWRKFFDFKKISFYIKLFIAIIPALAFGALFKKHIDAMLEKPMIIALIMLLGGVVLLFVDKWFQKPAIDKEEEITNKKAFIVGCYQVLSIIFPGLSRSAATIIGGMQQKLSRRLAAEFSFFLAVPTMLAATVKSLYDMYKEQPQVLNTDNLSTLLLGCGIAFVVALLAIKFFIGFLQKYGFKLFGWYRIVVGLALLILFYFKIIG
ncbi:undecaprenyl-diphosphate phosphatase [Niastella sp. OAS944]|uniref:undecaprenyl-diphosphate phosphatase n=1 Tax=Niastella sp. OAS944 TaxID=2664089 RepID=UPI00348AB812|nr:undecaprenyl-diphosphatase [Chitinophagaceae bacterium OAS944]